MQATMTGSRADEFTRVKVKLSALIASLDETVKRGSNSDSEFDQGAAHAAAIDARQLRQILDETALNTTSPEPKAAPELAAALAETAKIRDLFDQATKAVMTKRWALTDTEKRIIRGFRLQAGLDPQ